MTRLSSRRENAIRFGGVDDIEKSYSCTTKELRSFFSSVANQRNSTTRVQPESRKEIQRHLPCIEVNKVLGEEDAVTTEEEEEKLEKLICELMELPTNMETWPTLCLYLRSRRTQKLLCKAEVTEKLSMGLRGLPSCLPTAELSVALWMAYELALNESLYLPNEDECPSYLNDLLRGPLDKDSCRMR